MESPSNKISLVDIKSFLLPYPIKTLYSYIDQNIPIHTFTPRISITLLSLFTMQTSIPLHIQHPLER